MKFLATSVAAVAALGAAAAGLTSPATVTAPVQPVVFDAPLPLEPPDAALPSPDQLTGVLNGLADPNVPFSNKSYLVEGGLGLLESRTADKALQRAAEKGSLPLSFSVANIAPAGPGAATADVTASGPSTPAITQSLTFVDQGGWKLSRNSAMTLLQSVR
ncbi:hypothetical protein [Mycolicibacillus trivialis]|uniref:hypothetical protein n=1 Tax=Mycolicibacillus trivialis TaxID=1798 RepID=UPI000D6A6F72|nr:hypothetical protein [Mycolicibacillus trivialis]